MYTHQMFRSWDPLLLNRTKAHTIGTVQWVVFSLTQLARVKRGRELSQNHYFSYTIIIFLENTNIYWTAVVFNLIQAAREGVRGRGAPSHVVCASFLSLNTNVYGYEEHRLPPLSPSPTHAPLPHHHHHHHQPTAFLAPKTARPTDRANCQHNWHEHYEYVNMPSLGQAIQ